jgi:hypothetical protein
MLMKMEIKHGFVNRAHDIESLFDGTNKLSSFMRKLEKQSLIDIARYDANKYKGDGFEFLVEILLKSHAYDNRLGITSYEPVQSDDNGVDGFGFNIIGEKCVIQVKYRSNNKKLLTANKDHLSNMISDGMIKHKVVIPEENTECPRHYVITTANGLHHYTDNENFKGFVHCIGYDQLRAMLDNNISFWNLCREIVKNVSEKKKVC